MAKGDYSIRFDPDKLRGMIEDGKSAKEIMKTFKISKYTLREHLVMLQDRDKKLYVIKGLLDDPDADRKVNIKEGIIFSEKILEKTGFSPGDAFEMVVEDDKIILKKVSND